MDKCEVKGCKNQAQLTYYDKRVCDKCMNKHCNHEDTLNLKEEFKIKDVQKN